MRYLHLFILFFCLIIPKAQANEAMMQTMQSQLTSLQDLVKSLNSTVKDLHMTVENQNEVIKQQNMRINGLEGKKASSGQTADAPLKVAGLSQGFNPDIGVVGTVQAHLTESSEDEEGKDTITLKELELSFAQYVDPYSRLDVILALNDNLEDQNIDIEEAYYSHWGLPWGFTGRIGKFRTKIGKVNLSHLHQLDTVDYPVVIRDFFGEEGMSSSGLRLQNHIPNPFDVPLTLTGEILRGNNGESFSGLSRRPIFNSHLSSFFELNEDMNLEVGLTNMFGDENRDEEFSIGRDHFGVYVFGADATFTWNLDEGRRLKFQNEIFFQDRPEFIDDADERINQDPWGFYSLLDFKFNEKFSGGVRFDYVEPLSVVGEHNAEVSVSPYLTFWQSEFANFRVQYTHTQAAAAEAEVDNEQAVFLQANFLIGAHSHPVA